jgi:hypothetical protein
VRGFGGRGHVLSRKKEEEEEEESSAVPYSLKE